MLPECHYAVWLAHGFAIIAQAKLLQSIRKCGRYKAIMNPITWLTRKISIKNYVRKLRPELRKKYGEKRVFTPEQIVSTSRDLGLSEKYLEYAVVLYAPRDKVESYMTNANSALFEYAK